MKLVKFHIFLADLSPRMGTEPGKIRPVVVVQTDLLNNVHPSTLICPCTTQLVDGAEVLRVRLRASGSGLEKDSDILVDQLRAIDNRRFKKSIGKLGKAQREKLLENLRVLVLE